MRRFETNPNMPRVYIPPSDPGWLYLAEIEGRKVYRIGYSKDPEKRLESVNKQTGYTQHLICKMYYGNHIASVKTLWLYEFKDFGLSGDWVVLTKDQVDYFATHRIIFEERGVSKIIKE